MPDDVKPEHYSEKYKREIEALKAEVDRLTKALEASATMTVVGPAPDAVREAMVANAAMFAGCLSAGWEARGGDVASLRSILMTRWHAVRHFLSDVACGADVAAYDADVAKEAALEAAKAEVIRKDKEAAEVRRDAARRAQAAVAAGSV